MIERLIDASDLWTTDTGTVVHRSGDLAEYLYLVVAGSMGLVREMQSGRQFAAGLHLAGDFHGLGPVISQRPHINTATCKEKTVLVRIQGQVLRDLISSDGRLSFSLFNALEQRHLRALNMHASAAVDSMQTRVAGLIRSIDQRHARGESHRPIHLSQDEIAAMLGTRRQVVNRTLRKMAAEGVVKAEYGRILVADRQKLDAMAEGLDSP